MHPLLKSMLSQSCNIDEWNMFRNEYRQFGYDKLAEELLKTKKMLHGEVNRNRRLKKLNRDLKMAGSGKLQLGKMAACHPEYRRYCSQIEDTTEEMKALENNTTNPNRQQSWVNELHEAVNEASIEYEQLLYGLQQEQKITKSCLQAESQLTLEDNPTQQENCQLRLKIQQQKQHKSYLLKRVADEIQKQSKLRQQRQNFPPKQKRR